MGVFKEEKKKSFRYKKKKKEIEREQGVKNEGNHMKISLMHKSWNK